MTTAIKNEANSSERTQPKPHVAALGLRVETISISSLFPYPNNPRTHSKPQIRRIADSLTQFGWTNPVLADNRGNILAGHGRVAAAKLLGFDSVPVIRIESMSDAEKRAYIIADNRLAERAGWDQELLAIELQFLIDEDLDFEVELTGFDTGEIDLLLTHDSEDAEEPPAVPLPDAPVTSRAGDLWQVGEHRLFCGSALDEASWSTLMGGERAQMVFTDPPYNVPIAGHVSGLGKVRHREFAMACGEMSAESFTQFLATSFRHLSSYSADGAIVFVCMDWRHMSEVLQAGKTTFNELKNLCVWAKTNAGMGSFYRSQHELVFVFKSGTAPHTNNFGLGESGRHRSNLWTYAGVNSFRKDRMEDLAAHPTVKPLKLVGDAILDCSKRNGLIIDPFAGSGTTLVAAHRSGRRGAGIELDPAYIDLIVGRLEQETGSEAVLAATGETFAMVKTHREQEGDQ